ncbi:hypothetical protein [Geobacter grbiciae]|uniref:hypothetical protein n=1 Tax=Geobacter grbiciae TaxID=155042 RepID=UPI001FE5C2C7|nr:hypothetical protein [Geobacter grbiciae]
MTTGTGRGSPFECLAVKLVREEMGAGQRHSHGTLLPDRGRRGAVLAEMARNGLKLGESDLQVYVMCEILNR